MKKKENIIVMGEYEKEGNRRAGTTTESNGDGYQNIILRAKIN